MKSVFIKMVFIVAISILAFGFVNNTDKKKQDEHPEVNWNISCNECHSEETPEIFAAWESSLHGQVNFGCYICHGDGEETFYSTGSDETCIGCHAGQEVNFEKSKVNSCFDCHNGHTLKFHAN